MYNFFVNRLYDLSVNSFYNNSFFYFFIFSLQKNYYYLLQKENIKITYLNVDVELSGINKQNQVYVIYNHLKYDIFSLPKTNSLLNTLSQSNDISLNACLLFNSILYNNSYYSYNIRNIYTNVIIFFKKNMILFLKHLNIFSLFNIFFYNNNNFLNLFINIFLYKKIFINRFLFI